MKKYEVALLLREHGFKYSEIVRELYPEEWEYYQRTRDRRVYDRLRKRVWALLRWAREKSGHLSVENLDTMGLWTLREAPDLADNGGERSPLDYRSIELMKSPKTRKAGKKGVDRQLIEYEQYLYYLYKRHLEPGDHDRLLWNTIRSIHNNVFHAYYERYKANMWFGSRASRYVKTYAYIVLTVAGLVLGNTSIRYIMRSILEPDPELVDEIAGIVFSRVL